MIGISSTLYYVSHSARFKALWSIVAILHRYRNIHVQMCTLRHIILSWTRAAGAEEKHRNTRMAMTYRRRSCLIYGTSNFIYEPIALSGVVAKNSEPAAASTTGEEYNRYLYFQYPAQPVVILNFLLI